MRPGFDGRWKYAARAERVAASGGGGGGDRRARGVLQPSFLVHEAVARGYLVVILGDFRWPEIAIYTVWPQTRRLTARARAVIDFVSARIAPPPYWESFLDGAGA